MLRTIQKDFLFFIISLSLFAVTSVHAEFYRWVDDDGTIHYSDSLPPSKAQREQDKLNEHGRVVENVPAPKTIGQLQEEERLAKIEEEKKLKREKADRRDNMLLAMYLSVEDIETVRDERLATVQSAIDITQLRKKKFISKLESINASEQRFKANGQKVPSAIKKSRAHYQEQLANVNDILQIKEREKLAIKKRFAGDINRYIELKQPDLAAQ